LFQADWASADSWIVTGSAEPEATLFGQSLQVHSSQNDGFVAKADTSGAVEWVTMFPSSGQAFVFQPVVFADGRSVVNGYFMDDLLLPMDTLQGLPGVPTFFIALLNAEGAVEWAMPVTATGGAAIKDIKVDQNDDILLFGRYSGSLSINSSVVLQPYASTTGFAVRISPLGVCRSAWSFGRVWPGTGSILPTEHGLYLSVGFDSTLVMGSHVFQGTFEGDNLNITDLLIARFDSLSGFTSIPTLKTTEQERLHIYANPNNGLCTIELPISVKPGSDLVLTIHDAMGRVVEQSPLRWNEGALQLDIRAQAKGVYHAELLDGRQRYSGTIIFE
jgi:hypothetical protein